MRQTTSTIKTFYHPIEVAIRWAGLLRYESAILECIPSPRKLPSSLVCPRQHELQLYLDRIYDGIDNGELPYGQNGITSNEAALLDSPALTVRHLDLKRWMRTCYPEHCPDFLFSDSEQLVHPTLTLEAGQALLIERQTMQTELAQCHRQLHVLQQHRCRHQPTTPHPISERAETTYLSILGAILDLMLNCSPSGRRYSPFDTQAAIVSALVAHYGSKMGISERTLNGKFAKAKQVLHSTIV